ncbi:MAG: M20 family metallopeptidase [Desulfobacterales bacterium]|nr:M20 family metallopeptidase [Desulfobacterales bacterium]MDJ0855896.1 M20 family metallopeptidase [Desulfobacterales bacterium]MDJ0885952.1 M20 family metallopeptidase [Desulfobacterales bacterium]
MDLIELTRRLIRFETINPPGNEEACARFLGRMLEDGGFRVAYHALTPGRVNVIARSPASGGGGKPTVLSGHLDTVPLGSAVWRHEPTGAQRVDGRIYGRGASDMKSGVAAMVLAALAEGADVPVTLILSAGEETGCEGVRSLADQGCLEGPVRALVIGEPTANYPLIGHKGAFWLEMEARGRAAHGSQPELGDNAIVKAAEAIQRLMAIDFDGHNHPLLGPPTVNVGTIAGGININSVPDRAVAGLDIRTVPGLGHDALRTMLEEGCGDFVRFRVMADMEGFASDPRDPWIRRVFDLAAPYLDEPPVPRGAPYFTDAATLAAAYGHPPAVILGPGEPSQAHQTDEFVVIRRIEDAQAIYRAILRL